MNILMITQNDPAGMGVAFKNAINRHTEHSCRLITTEIRYNFYFEKDLHVPNLDQDGFDEIVQLLKNADLFHFHLLADENIQLGPIKVGQYVGEKRIIHHHHGHPHFRSHSEFYRDKYRNLKRKVMVSTPDLVHLLPEATWQPNLVPIKAPPYRPTTLSHNGTIRVGQAPTRKDLKNTNELIQVMERVQRTLGDRRLELDIIEHCLYSRCLERKNQCHVIFDHMQGYYGVSSLESLSQGKPVIAGLDDWNVRWIREFTGTDNLPWVIARNSDELEDRLGGLIQDDGLREHIGRRSRRFMEARWSEPHVLRMLLDVYEAL
jgi:glycosyltransferase involved in cell wall biosynthesis